MIRVTLSLLVVLFSSNLVRAEEVISFQKARDKQAECAQVLADKQFRQFFSGVPDYDLAQPYAQHVLELARNPQPGLTILAITEGLNPSELLIGVSRLRRAERKPTLFVAEDGSVHSNMDVTLHSLAELKSNDFDLREVIRNQLVPFLTVPVVQYGAILKKIQSGQLFQEQEFKDIPEQQRAILEKLLGEFLSTEVALQQRIRDNPEQYRVAVEAVMNELPSIETDHKQSMFIFDLSMGPYETLRDERYVIEEYLHQLALLAERTGAAVVVSVPVQKFQVLHRSAPFFKKPFTIFNLTPIPL